MKARIFLAAFWTLVSLTAGYAQSLDKAKTDQFFDRLAEKNKAMGALTITKDGNVLYSRAIGYGQINGTEMKPLTAASRFRIGSITKMFTAVMILQLADEGKFKLSDTLDNYLPQIPNSERITIAQILAHRSGIPDIFADGNSRPQKTQPISTDELLLQIAKGTPNFEPDTRHAYSEAGYIVLGLVIEKFTGKSYADALEQRVTAKIGLKDTYVATGNIDVSKNEALSYRLAGGGQWQQERETHSSVLFGGGSIISTPSDLTKFIQALFDGKLISQASVASMTSMREGEGLGMEPFMWAGKTFYGHTGGVDNFGAWLAYLPDEKLAIAYTTNAKVYPVAKIVSGFVDIYYHRPFQIPAFEQVVVSPELLDKYVGAYSISGTSVKCMITRDGTTLLFQLMEQSALPLEATTQSTFCIESPEIIFEFDAAKDQMTQKRGGRERTFTKEQ